MRLSHPGQLCILLLAMCLTAAPVMAQAPDVEKKVTLNLKDVPLRNAIELLFAGSGLQFSIDPNVPNIPISLQIRDVSLQAALRLVIRQAATAAPGLTVNREGDIFVVRIRP